MLCEAVRYGNRLWVVPVQKTKELAKRKGSFGTFYEYGIKELEELIPAINKKIQTMTCYGYDIQKLRRVVRDSRLRGIDRIVPLGQAMTFEPTWDGMDLIERLSREIS